MWDIFCVCVWGLMLGIGFVGCVLPYPGYAFIFGGCVLFSAMQGLYPARYVRIILALPGVAGVLADNAFALLGAKKFGAVLGYISGVIAKVILGIVLVALYAYNMWGGLV